MIEAKFTGVDSTKPVHIFLGHAVERGHFCKKKEILVPSLFIENVCLTFKKSASVRAYIQENKEDL